MDLSPTRFSSIMENCNLQSLHELGNTSEIAEHLESDLQKGIKSKDSITQRQSKYGSNFLPDIPVRSFWSLLKEALSDQTILILIGCAIFSLVFEVLLANDEDKSTAWIDCAAILMAVTIVSLVQTISNRNQELQFAEVNKIKSIFPVTVIRCGEHERISNFDLVVGDLVCLEPGDKIPADGITVTTDNLRVDQSNASGESETVFKDVENDPFLISGTHVVEGRCTFLVLCVGPYSNSGRIFKLLENEQKLTPLQEKLENLASSIGFLGMIAAGVTFAALTIGWIITQFRFGFELKACKELFTFLINALTIIVVAVPEGLPLAVTISLAYSMRQMMSDNNFVRRLSACETMGSATVICTDKTGTLTMNQMNAERIITGDKNCFDVNVNNLEEMTSPEFLQKIADSISCNTTAVLSRKSGDIGSQTETALLRLVNNSLKMDYKLTRDQNEIVKDFQFDRIRKRMTTIVKSKNSSSVVQYTKGAPEELLALCTSYLDSNGALHELDEETRSRIFETINEHCKKAYRVIALCMKTENIDLESSNVEKGLTFICCVSIRDSLRPSTKGAISDCQRAGIRVIMITGDNPTTAQAIANDCGILTPQADEHKAVCLGSDLRNLNEEELSQAVSSISVVARATPLDKYIIVKALQGRGEIVAVTGDGTNDAAALRKADVGLSMGKCGTELAKEASDIVVLDDDFQSIVKSVLWGRCIFNNVRRFLQFQLTANVSTLLISVLSSLILNDTPFKAVQLLWVNLIMDSLGALSLATGRPHLNLLDKHPQKRKIPLISSFMIMNVVSQALFQLILVTLILFIHPGIETKSVHHYTLIFNVFVYCQMFNLFNARVVEYGDSFLIGINDNALFMGILIGIGIVEFVLVQFCDQFFACVPLSMKEQLLSLVVASLCIPFGMFMRKSPNNPLTKLIEDGRNLFNAKFHRKTD